VGHERGEVAGLQVAKEAAVSEKLRLQVSGWGFEWCYKWVRSSSGT
jgi:hypothetical protein